MTRFACIGYGEVGRTLGATLAESGGEAVYFDPQVSSQGDDGVTRCETLEDALRGSDYVLSMVTTSATEKAASACAVHLTRGQTYIDLASAHPDVKRAIAPIIGASGAVMIEGAILGLIAATGAKTRTLLTGANAKGAAETLSEHGLNCEAYEGEIGAASTFKLLRSIFSKGVEAVLLETMLAARKAGLEKDVRAEIQASFEQVPFHKMAESWMTSHGLACRRRRDEMVQVEELLSGLGLEAIMTGATTALFDRSVAMDLDRSFDTPPGDSDAVLTELERND